MGAPRVWRGRGLGLVTLTGVLQERGKSPRRQGQRKKGFRGKTGMEEAQFLRQKGVRK